jgi:Domain of unknown function (DUF6924)
MIAARTSGGTALITLPDTSAVPVVRLDFSNEQAWEQLKQDLTAPDEGSGYEAALEFVERRDLAGMTGAEFDAETPRLYPHAYEHPILIVVDAVTMGSPERPVLLLDLSEDETSPSFRSLPREVSAIEANLSIANMDFFEFGDSADPDGVFRGFR